MIARVGVRAGCVGMHGCVALMALGGVACLVIAHFLGRLRRYEGSAALELTVITASLHCSPHRAA